MNPLPSGAGSQGTQPFEFDDVLVDPAARILVRGGVERPLEPKAFTVLLVLLQRRGELVGRDELLDAVWGHRHVTPGVLTRAIAQLRHALEDDSQHPRYIQTRHALGYAFIGELRMRDPPAPGPPVPASPVPDPCTLDPSTVDPATVAVSEVASDPLDASAAAPGRSPAVWSETPGPPEPQAHEADRSTLRPPVRGPWRWALAAVLLAGLAALGWMHEGAPPAARPAASSIAVMPFSNLGADHGDDYFADGLTEEMRDALAGVPGLKVAAPLSRQAHDSALDARQWGARLGVATILEASVRRDGPQLRVTAHLADTTTGFTLWSHTYDRQLTGVFETQREIAAEVVRSLLGAMPAADAQLAKRLAPTRNEAAFDAYLQGLQLLHRAARAEDAEQAVQRFGQALAGDPAFALAQAKICRSEIWQFENGRDAAAFARAMAACRRAAQMDPTLAEVNLAMGDLYRAHGDLERALGYYRQSSGVPATSALAHVGMGKVYVAQGQPARAIGEFATALELSPGDAGVQAQIGYQQYVSGDLTHALASYRKVVALRPNEAEGWSILGALYLEAGDSAASEQALAQAIGIAPDAASLSNLGLIKFQAGDYAAAIALRRRASALAPQDFLVWANLGEALQADPGRGDEAHDAYRKAADQAARYLALKPDDAAGWASLGLYRAILGETPAARALVQRSEALATAPGEVALLNAETLARLGDLAAARERIARARAAGVPEIQLTSNLTFRRLSLLAPARAPPAGPASTAPSTRKGPTPGA
ncbi:winged helix-turn-helix domain-containing protein [Dyella sp.]|jgi:TolB-like protein/DNA-binding winged helix-turn-helix (wHTH) protein/tetratricopeptide (TPR) repeat protein|uniref:winged helix-turn-helix domain-containing protein n=1 Tax=Dyella sp. TaxID=1869338 RepID=UPI002D789D22|nr:winged helix-turn-helix domain-containing protein [Dyella sp.]HET6431012.1 winged helix-turn-helix domain-containing protein [Dyella sp.]